MTVELFMILGLLVCALVLFAIGKPRMDVVAVMAIAALPLTGVITVREALAGFADPSVILIAALFVIGDALVRTGVAQWLGDQMSLRAGGDERRLIVLLMLSAASLSAFMSSTGVVAIFIPIVLRIARSAGVPAGRLMMPLSMAALISGMMTLVATPPNMVINSELIRHGDPGFGFFAFTPFGIPVLVLAIFYMVAVRSRLTREPETPLPRRPRMRELVSTYDLHARMARLRISDRSDLAGRRLGSLDLRAIVGVNVVVIERHRRRGHEFILPAAETELRAGDVLFLGVLGDGFDLRGFREDHGLEELPLNEQDYAEPRREIGVAEAMIPPGSALAGSTPSEARLRSSHGLTVIGIKRGPDPVPGPAASVTMRAGDTLLLMGPWRSIRRLGARRHDLVPLELPEEADDYVPERKRAPYAVGVLVAVVVAMASGLLPNAQAALIGCLALGVFGCIDMTSAYRAIHWQTLVLIAGMLPFALALERSGGVEIAAQGALEILGDSHPRALLAAIFIATTTLSLFISNTATAVLMGPVALAMAKGIGASPYPFAMCVALAASTAFMTPVSSPVNLLVMAPGGYRFMDFVRIGTPFTIVTLAVTLLLLPVLLPLY